MRMEIQRLSEGLTGDHEAGAGFRTELLEAAGDAFDLEASLAVHFGPPISPGKSGPARMTSGA